jgi:hypothetical protein
MKKRKIELRTVLRFSFFLLIRIIVSFSIVGIVIGLFWGFLYVLFYKVLGMS